MRYATPLALLVLLASPPLGADVENRTGRLAGPGTRVAETEAARSALRAIASGLTDDPETREAVFALAEHAAGAEGPLDGDALRFIESATSLYTEDPRTPRLLRLLAEGRAREGDPFGAHMAYRRLVESEDADDDPELIAAAIAVAAAAGDIGAVLDWSNRIDPEPLPEPLHEGVLLARLKAAAASSRPDVALTAAGKLQQLFPEALRLDAGALLAAAKTFEDVALLEESIRHYELFVNLHPKHPELAEAKLTLGTMQARVGRLERARRSLDWLIEAHPTTAQAQAARMARLGLDGEPADASKLAEYLQVVRDASTVTGGRKACETFVSLYVGAGMPLEVLRAVLELVREDTGGLASFAARQCVTRTLDSVILLLSRREDHVSIVLAVSEIESLGMEVPQTLIDTVAASRVAIGLPPTTPGPVEAAIDNARRARREERWGEMLAQIEESLLLVPDPYRRSSAEAHRLMAEALWRLQRTDDALDAVRRSLEFADEPGTLRAGRVLLADILFSSRATEDACVEYRRARVHGESRWVGLQLERCDPQMGSGG